MSHLPEFGEQTIGLGVVRALTGQLGIGWASAVCPLGGELPTTPRVTSLRLQAVDEQGEHLVSDHQATTHGLWNLI